MDGKHGVGWVDGWVDKIGWMDGIGWGRMGWDGVGEWTGRGGAE